MTLSSGLATCGVCIVTMFALWCDSLFGCLVAIVAFGTVADMCNRPGCDCEDE